MGRGGDTGYKDPMDWYRGHFETEIGNSSFVKRYFKFSVDIFCICFTGIFYICPLLHGSLSGLAYFPPKAEFHMVGTIELHILRFWYVVVWHNVLAA